MNEEESIHAFQRLTKILNESHMEWVSQQVSEQIQIGRTIQREIETFKEGKEMPLFSTIDDYSSKLMKGPRVTFPVTVEYESNERLELLIDAIKQAIVDTAEMEQHLIDFIEKDERSPKNILFYADEPNSEPKSISKETISARYENTKLLNNLLETLRKEISK